MTRWHKTVLALAVMAVATLPLLDNATIKAWAQEQQRLANIIILNRLELASGVLTSARLRTGLSDESGSGVAVFGTAPTIATATLTLPIISTESVTAAGGTETLDSTDCGQMQLLDTAAGSVVTLPAATGSGCTFRFVVTVTNTSNDHSIVVVGNDNLIGGLLSMGTTADQSDAFSCVVADACDAVQMNGSTEGGIAGTWIVVQDVAADTWAITGVVISTDASATMLVAGVVS